MRKLAEVGYAGSVCWGLGKGDRPAEKRATRLAWEQAMRLGFGLSWVAFGVGLPLGLGYGQVL